MSCFIPDTCLNLEKIQSEITEKLTPESQKTFNDILTNVKKLMLYKKINTTNDGYVLNDKSMIDRRLSKENMKNLMKENVLLDTFLKGLYLILATVAIVVFIFFTKNKNAKNYGILALALVLPLSMTLYNKLIY